MAIYFRDLCFTAVIAIALWGRAAHGQIQWAKRIASTTNQDNELSIGMILDPQGNCYVTGWFDGTNDCGGVILTNSSGGGQDIFVAKYNSSGALQWAWRAGGNSPNWDVGRGIGVDTNGNVYVTGGFYGPADFGHTNLAGSPAGREEFFLAKYDSAGTVQWVRPSAGGSRVYGTGLAVDSAGNCYALGYAGNGATPITFGTTNLLSTNTTGYSAFLVKYDNSGTIQWGQLLGSPGFTYATGVAADAVGNVYVRGTFSPRMTIGTNNLVVGPPGSTKNMFVAKFSNFGALLWVQQPKGGEVSGEGGVAVDPAGNVYATGDFSGTLSFSTNVSLTSGGSHDAFLAKYSSAGAILWPRQAGGGTNLGEYVGWYVDVALDAKGNVYPAGFVSASGAAPSGPPVAVVAKYDPLGTLQWACGGSPFAMKCAVDSAGNCFLAGWYQGTATFGTNVLSPQGYWNYFLAKVAPPALPTLGLGWTSGVPRVSLTGTIGSMYSLQGAPRVAGTNTPWQTLTTLALTNSPQVFLDAGASARSNRFYRAGPPAL